MSYDRSGSPQSRLVELHRSSLDPSQQPPAKDDHHVNEVSFGPSIWVFEAVRCSVGVDAREVLDAGEVSQFRRPASPSTARSICVMRCSTSVQHFGWNCGHSRRCMFLSDLTKDLFSWFVATIQVPQLHNFHRESLNFCVVAAYVIG